MFVKCMMAAAVLMLGATGCIMPWQTQAEEDAPLATTSSAVRSGGAGDYRDDDTPTPLDHPVPVIDFPSLHTPAPPDLDLFNEQWERNPTGRGCYITYVTIYDPAKSRKLELPVTVCN